MVCCWSAIRARWRVSDWGNRGLALAWSVLRASPPEYRPKLRSGVHVPRCCHPLVRPSSSVAERYTFWLPVKEVWNVTGTAKVRLLPDKVTEAPVPLIVHCLLETVPATPGVTDPC